MADSTRKAAVDWPMIRQRYEATDRREASTRQIARDHRISETAVRKKAKAESWLRRDQREYLLYGKRAGSGAKIIDWPGSRLRGKPVLTRAHRERGDRKVSSQDLIDGLSDVAQSLLSELKIAIDRRKIIIRMIEEWEPGSGGRLTAKYSALQKEVDVKRLASAALNIAMVSKIITEISSGGGKENAASKR